MARFADERCSTIVSCLSKQLAHRFKFELYCIILFQTNFQLSFFPLFTYTPYRFQLTGDYILKSAFNFCIFALSFCPFRFACTSKWIVFQRYLCISFCVFSNLSEFKIIERYSFSAHTHTQTRISYQYKFENNCSCLALYFIFRLF